ncbi:RepB family plasmid replication initiator protein [Limosilactobacillus reuteri]|uniref:RepB family plasmid replication initiator protein n=1 Tax=Limosilactobacillus reuteri TaxID=1598 RepID=UPI001E5EEC1B|nr:RepB family plasmid replication initiator protein [Limosilactobacillus reuteri]MCC4370549.1 RepB family plasmid replication initiator protein [Limosilactobacillus reuteri]MCC4371882.1 RepB family plasmid replication initiator protein [Limosilactobacillus reuteri]MCC4509353.1 RepB family plasmid replication initiator protein [Limosilactobacillus reuteri]MCC4509396.1 RepB family plasmid replication initiator protein [Limosilactobacillus reuteri]
MNELNNINEQIVVQHNDLIKAVAEMDRMPLKLFEIIVGSYDDRKRENTVRIKKQVIYTLLDVKASNRATRLRNTIRDLHRHATFHFEHTEDDGTVTEHSIAPIQEFTWNSARDYVEVVFAPALLPYISLLQNNFTKYKLTDVAGLNSKHAITLYKLLAMNYNQAQYYQNHPEKLRSQEQITKYANPIFSVKDLRHITSTEEKYKGRFSSFERIVLKAPIQEINSHTDFSITYEKLKHGRSITAIQFHIEKNNITASENSGGITQPENKNNPQQPVDQEVYKAAVANPITPLLATNKIISMLTVMQEQQLMINLANQVYPVYEDIATKYGDKALEQHLSYLGSHIGSDLKGDALVAYLKKAAKNRLAQLAKKAKTSQENQRGHRKIQEEMPEWSKRSEKDKMKKASPEEVAKLKERIANRKK